MDAASWPQGLQDMKVAKSMEEISSNACSRPIMERKARPQEQLNCPRCNSTNTKFCYYNNYSLTQPRYFCKTCRRYWTEGGSLRSVPVGGGSRKNKRSSMSSSSTSSKLPDLNPPSISQFSSQNPKIHQGQDLNLAFPIQDSQGISYFLDQAPKTEISNSTQLDNTSSCSSNYNSALELLRSGIASRGLHSFIPTPIPDSNTLYSSSGYPMQEFKPTLNFGVEELGDGNRYNGVEENGGKILFPLGEVKQFSSTNPHDHAVDQNKSGNGFWNGMFGGSGGSW